MDGIINVFKPAGMTSMNVISRVRRIIGEKKVGHTGTLDPEVTGVLPIFAGKATKAINYVQNGGKTYSCEMILGMATDTQDTTGTVLSETDCVSTDVEITECLMSFVGAYNQTPPMYSAKRVDGKRLYDLARKGIEIERKLHPVEIYSIKVLGISRSDGQVKVKFDVDCSRGTYIRTLCSDAGAKLGCGGCMAWLQRTRSCGFGLSDSVTLEELEKAFLEGTPEKVVAHTESLFVDYPRVDIAGEILTRVLNGVTVEVPNLKATGLHSLYDGDRFIGLCNVTEGTQSDKSKVKIERKFND